VLLLTDCHMAKIATGKAMLLFVETNALTGARVYTCAVKLRDVLTVKRAPWCSLCVT
jgi:hypothetical protein